MEESFRIFNLLLGKNFKVRIRHWKMILILQILIPVVLIMLTQLTRSLSTKAPIKHENSTYYEIMSEMHLAMQLDHRRHLYFVPNDSCTQKFMVEVGICSKIESENVKGFDNEDDLINAYLYHQAASKGDLAMAIVFEENLFTRNCSMQQSLKYKIRHSGSISNDLYQNTLGQLLGSAAQLYYFPEPFVQEQMCVDKTYINSIKPSSMNNINMSIQQMPYPPYVEHDAFDLQLRLMVSSFAITTLLIPLCVEIHFTSKEKSVGVNVLMAMNGVTLAQNLLAWLCSGIIFSILYTIPITILFKNTMSNKVDPFLYYSNGFLFWFLLTVHIIHLISYGMHIAGYFSKPRFVTIVLSIIYTATLSLRDTIIGKGYYSLLPYLGILFPNMLSCRLFEELNTFEYSLIGMQWNSLFVPGNPVYGVTGSLGFILIFSIMGSVFHFFLAIYANYLFPGQYGISKSPLFFLEYFRKNKVYMDEEASEFDYDKVDGEDFEAVPKNVLIPGIQIRDLKKSYQTSWLRKSLVQAIKGISIDFYKGQITALLGHNGAGKTTLMSILTGVTNETSGKVFINGINISKDMDQIRNNLGLCPQENMVFPDLNVEEQIEFFGLLKGRDKSKVFIKQQVNSLLNKLKIAEKKSVLPDKLSGGQKRRLCLGIALIGDANILILDEPTSGMDPETRRDTWDILLKLRGEKTILLSTHNMEEADILGDRIAIVHTGRLKCYGTSLFLKKQYGHGRLEVTLSAKPTCDSQQIINMFDSSTEQVTVNSEKIVLSALYTESLPQILDNIESEKTNLGITGISVSLITLEQVFLKIIKKEDNNVPLNELQTVELTKLDGWELNIQMLSALIRKKFTCIINDLKNVLLMIFFPLISIVLMSLGFVRGDDSTNVLSLGLNMYRYPQSIFSSDNKIIEQIYKTVVESFDAVATNVTSVSNASLDLATENFAEYRNNLIVAAEFNITNSSIINANGLYSGIAVHGVPITVNLITNTLLKYFSNSNNFSIELSSQKFPATLSSTKIASAETSLTNVLMFCSFYFPTIALFVIQPLVERCTQMKQLQRMAGVSSLLYWSTHFICDLVVFIVSLITIISGFVIMDIVLGIRMYYKIEILIMTLLLLLFGINALLINYIFSFINKSKSTVSTILGLTPIGIVIIQYLIHQIIGSYDYLELLHSMQKRIFRLIPHVSFFHGQMSFFSTASENARCRRLSNRLLEIACDKQILDECCERKCMDHNCKLPLPYFQDWETDISLDECVTFLALTPFIYFTILIMMEERFFQRLFSYRWSAELKNPSSHMDDQVKEEKNLIANEINKLNEGSISQQQKITSLNRTNDENKNLFMVHELSKYYGKLIAVREVSFRVKHRECFGLLGVNGAGKSTTFRMLTGDELPNSGTMYLGNSEIHSDRKRYLSQMGYCPQTDALIKSLNTFDHLRLFARLRGIRESNVESEVNKWINRLNLTACMKQPSGTYSGGNKRRLNIAMALIGNPKLVLLDEPTTGVDPAARRSLWNVLQSRQAAGQAIILTSHSMEECEALCNRLVIMVKGEFVCVGASQELKHRFGAGYNIHVKLNPGRSQEDFDAIKTTITSNLPCKVTDENLGFLGYHVRNAGTTWQLMYNTMNGLKERYDCIEDFAVLSATLEQLFIQFARGAENDALQDDLGVTSQEIDDCIA